LTYSQNIEKQERTKRIALLSGTMYRGGDVAETNHLCQILGNVRKTECPLHLGGQNRCVAMFAVMVSPGWEWFCVYIFMNDVE
jgi:hypothetical protein